MKAPGLLCAAGALRSVISFLGKAVAKFRLIPRQRVNRRKLAVMAHPAENAMATQWFLRPARRIRAGADSIVREFAAMGNRAKSDTLQVAFGFVMLIAVIVALHLSSSYLREAISGFVVNAVVFALRVRKRRKKQPRSLS